MTAPNTSREPSTRVALHASASSVPSVWPGPLSRHYAARLRLLAFVAALLLVMMIYRVGDAASFNVAEVRLDYSGKAEAHLAQALLAKSLVLNPGDVEWLEPEGFWPDDPVLFAARHEGGNADIYYAEVLRNADGEVLSIDWLRNLTHTSSADEGRLARFGGFVGYVSKVGDAFDAVTLLGVDGEPASWTREWPLRARLQNQISNLQDQGRRRGFDRQRYVFDPPVKRVRLGVDGEGFLVRADENETRLTGDEAPGKLGDGRIALRESAKGMPGTISWVVDTVRAVSWVGPEPIEWLEHRVFGAKDLIERLYHGLRTEDVEQVAEKAAEELDVTEEERKQLVELSVPDPELGWPPRALTPLLEKQVRGEGQWIAVVDDFVNKYENAPPTFYRTFIRADELRDYTRVYITVWDPRQVQLGIVAGTREPISATGETGAGRAPRDPALLKRMVGGFNGGFQAMHGEFGMMADGRVYLPPKPWAATVAVDENGQVSMGSWAAPPEGVSDYEEEWAKAQIPKGMKGFRQNLTSVVEDGAYNPFGRWWWGAAPLQADEQTYIHRSGLCLTEEGFMAYFWGESMGPEEMGKAMSATRCVRGMHLDMNAPHTALEMYSVTDAAHPFAPVDRPLRNHEFEGPMPGAPDLTLRARLMVRSMRPMRFPRYAGRDGRDFFYLYRRPVLPGPPLSGAARHDSAPSLAHGAGPLDGAAAAKGHTAEQTLGDAASLEGHFDAHGLPHRGWPYAFARAMVGGDSPETAKAWAVRIDPNRAVPEPVQARDDEHEPLAYLTATAGEALSPVEGGDAQVLPTTTLFAEPFHHGLRYRVGEPSKRAQVVLQGPVLQPIHRAALGVDAEGFLFYAELTDQGGPQDLRLALDRAGVVQALGLGDASRLAFTAGDQFMGPARYAREVDPSQAIAFVDRNQPASRVLFPDVEPLPYRRWWRMQDTRVRYFKDENREARFKKDTSEGEE